jgi:ubiquinone/menaquinone biosynthesis C-methylase UbiE
MNNQSKNELQFWQNLVNSERDHFSFRRANDFKRREAYLEMNLSGRGLEIGSGCLSMFEFSNAQEVVAIDPLMEEYKQIYPLDQTGRIKYLLGDGENLSFANHSFDWVALFNVIDHTPNPEKMIGEIKRVLKKGGILYFDVNFDDVLSPCHYRLWRIEDVRTLLKDFKLISEKIVRNDSGSQFNYYGKYEI